MKRSLVVAISVLLLVSGCAAHPVMKPFTTHYGESAVTIANHIKGCTNVAHSDIGDGTKTGMTSAATCTLDGRTITIDSYTDADSADPSALVKASKIEQYWAAGTGWTAFETDDSIIQFQLTNNGGEITKYEFGKTMPVPDVSGEKAAATAVAKSLHGHVQHFAG